MKFENSIFFFLNPHLMARAQKKILANVYPHVTHVLKKAGTKNKISVGRRRLLTKKRLQAFLFSPPKKWEGEEKSSSIRKKLSRFSAQKNRREKKEQAFVDWIVLSNNVQECNRRRRRRGGQKKNREVHPVWVPPSLKVVCRRLARIQQTPPVGWWQPTGPGSLHQQNFKYLRRCTAAPPSTSMIEGGGFGRSGQNGGVVTPRVFLEKNIFNVLVQKKMWLLFRRRKKRVPFCFVSLFPRFVSWFYLFAALIKFCSPKFA